MFHQLIKLLDHFNNYTPQILFFKFDSLSHEMREKMSQSLTDMMEASSSPHWLNAKPCKSSEHATLRLATNAH